LTLYGARHAFATYAVEAAGNVFAVADVTGHEDLKTTKVSEEEFDRMADGATQSLLDGLNNRYLREQDAKKQNNQQ
jgi:hypothetical protein